MVKIVIYSNVFTFLLIPSGTLVLVESIKHIDTSDEPSN